VDRRSAAAKYRWRNLVYRDDFCGSSLDDSWVAYNSAGHGGNGTRSPEQITLSDGVLRMIGTEDGTTAGMSSRYAQRYGRWEIRARFPAGCGCYHPVLILWPQSGSWPEAGEIDFAEVMDPNRQKLNFNLHYATHPQAARTVEVPGVGAEPGTTERLTYLLQLVPVAGSCGRDDQAGPPAGRTRPRHGRTERTGGIRLSCEILQGRPVPVGDEILFQQAVQQECPELVIGFKYPHPGSCMAAPQNLIRTGHPEAEIRPERHLGGDVQEQPCPRVTVETDEVELRRGHPARQRCEPERLENRRQCRRVVGVYQQIDIAGGLLGATWHA
jgi:hypothetical protein